MILTKLLNIVESIPPFTQRQVLSAMSVLDCLKVGYPTAVIAGGAPRDWLLGRNARDIDVFIYEPNLFYRQPEILIHRIKELTGLDVTLRGEQYDTVQPNDQGLLFVFEGSSFPNTYQIMVHDREVRDVYKRFPISLSRYWVSNTIENGFITICNSVLAEIGFQTNKIFCREEREFTEQQRAYLMKVWEKVPNYEVVGDQEGYAYAEREGLNPQLEYLD